MRKPYSTLARCVACLALLAACCLAAAQPSPSPPVPDQVVDRAKGAVVFIHSVLPGGKEVTGSGFFVSGAGYILTCRHVIANASKIWVRLSDGTTKVATTVTSLDVTDLALLKLDAVNTPFIQFGNTGRLREGDPVAVVGYPVNRVTGAEDLTVSRGVVRQFRSNRQFFQIDAEVNPGASGGPVLDRGGSAIGVAWADLPDAPAVNFAISVNEAWKLLDKTSSTIPMAVYLKLLTSDITRGTVLDMTGKDWVAWKDEEKARHLAGLMAAFNVVRLYVQDYDAALADKKGERIDGGRWVLNSLRDVWRLPFSLEEYQKELDAFYKDPDSSDTLVILALFLVNQRMMDRAGRMATPAPAESPVPSS